jgi:hypothetical protein
MKKTWQLARLNRLGAFTYIKYMLVTINLTIHHRAVAVLISSTSCCGSDRADACIMMDQAPGPTSASDCRSASDLLRQRELGRCLMLLYQRRGSRNTGPKPGSALLIGRRCFGFPALGKAWFRPVRLRRTSTRAIL